MESVISESPDAFGQFRQEARLEAGEDHTEGNAEVISFLSSILLISFTNL
jgi:hypothetical protein